MLDTWDGRACNSPSRGQLENELENNYSICSLGSEGGYFLSSDNTATRSIKSEHYNSLAVYDYLTI